MEWVRKREKSIPTFINFDGNFYYVWGNQRLKENAAFLIFWSEIWQCTCQTHTSSHFCLYTIVEYMREREHGWNQTPHPDVLVIFSMWVIRTETFAFSLVIILSMTFPSLFLISDKWKRKLRLWERNFATFIDGFFEKFFLKIIIEH